MSDRKRLRKAAGFLGLTTIRVSIVLWIGCSLSVIGALVIKGWRDHDTRADFNRGAEHRVRALRREIDENFWILHVFRAYFETPREDGPERYVRFARQAVTANPNVLSFEWAPRITDAARPAFEAELRLRNPNFSGIFSGRPGGKSKPLPSHAEYFPISYIFPPNDGAPFVGYDLLSSPATEPAAKRAISTGEPSSTGSLKLWEKAAGGYGIASFQAAYDAPDKGRSPQWRIEHCRGLVLSVTPSESLVNSALHNFEDSGIGTYLLDLSAASDDRRLLYAHGSAQAHTLRGDESLLSRTRISVGGRDWEVVCVGTGMASTLVPWQSVLFLFGGLFGTFGFALYLRMLSRYAHDIAAANDDLMREVEDRQKAQDDLAFQAYHDPLTGLPNRRQFSLRLEQSIQVAKASGDTLALLYVDLDGFKIINDSLGHAVGDAVLKGVGDRFRNCIGKSDVVARTGGDEFNLLLASPHSSALAERIAQGLLDVLNRPFEIENRTLSLSASIGISKFPIHGQDSQELAHCADSAMYFAKKRGKNRYHCYSTEMTAHTRRGMELALSLRGAIERNELCMFFQPIIGFGAEPTLRFEALIRWRHPKMGLLEPGQFFTKAEEAGLAAPIGRWVLREACCAAAQWQRHSRREIGVAVNVSGLQFSRADFLDAVDAALTESALRPSLLELEITESSVVSELEEALPRLAALRRKGIKIAIDDFGTGYSSLSYLETLPIDTLKIDRSFVPKTENNYRRWSLLRSLVALGRSMELRVVLEGVESAQQFDRVKKEMGPTEVQGFLFSKPLSPTAALEFIQSWNNKQGTPELEMLFEAARPPADLKLIKTRQMAG